LTKRRAWAEWALRAFLMVGGASNA